MINNKNGYILHIFGLRRSGNHLITQMLEKNAFPNKKVSFFNDVYNPRSKNPRVLTAKDVNIENTRNSVVILGYENVELNLINSLPTILDEASILPRATSTRILVIRDPYNFIASWLKMADTVLPNGEIFKSMREIPVEDVKSLWKAYAREALDETSFLGQEKVIVKYNDWVDSRRYRDFLIKEQFGVDNMDIGINQVSEYGHGSSFDGVSFDGSASLMQVESRWKAYERDPRYKLFSHDPEIRNLSLRLFDYSPTNIEGRRKTKER